MRFSPTAARFIEISQIASIDTACQGSMSIASEGFQNATLVTSKGFEYLWNVFIIDEDRT